MLKKGIVLDESYLKYDQFCNVYKQYVKEHQLAMHIQHTLGEKCEIDWIESTIPIYNMTLQNIIGKAYLFVGVLLFTQYMFSQASLDMKEER